MVTSHQRICIFINALLMIAVQVWAEDVRPIEFSIYDGEAESRFTFGDVDGNGTDELIMLSRPKDNNVDQRTLPRILLIDPESFQALEQINIDVFGDIYIRKDPEDGKLLLGIVHPEGFTGFVSEYDRNGTLIRQQSLGTGIDNYEDGIWQGHCGHVGNYDANGDAIPDMLFYISSGYDESPRDLILINGADFSIIRRLETPFLLSSGVYIEDIDNDQKGEIVIATYACDNGVRVDDMSDSVASFTVFRGDLGARISHMEFGGAFTKVVIAGFFDFDKDGVKEAYLIMRNNNSKLFIEKNIFVVDPVSGIIEKEKLGPPAINLNEGTLVDFDNDGSPSLVHIASDKKIYKYSPDLELLTSTSFEGELSSVNMQIAGSIDPDSDYSSELLLYYNMHQSEKSTFIALDSELRVQARAVVPELTNWVETRELRNPASKTKQTILTSYGYAANIRYAPLPLITDRHVKWAGWAAAGVISLACIAITVLFFRQRAQTQILAAADRNSEVLSIMQEVLHNIKTQLSVFSSDVDYLRRETDSGRIDPAYGEAINDLQSSFQNIHQRTRSLLTLSRLDEPVLEDVDLGEFLQQTATELGSEAAFTWKINDRLPGPQLDVQQMRSVFLNLFENAFKAGGEDSTVTVIADYYKSLAREQKKIAGTWIRVSVIDNGPGIAEDNLEKIFYPGFSTFKGGLGIGLAISKQIVERHYGRLSAENIASRGAAFHVDIPCT